MLHQLTKELLPSELTSLLLHVMRERSKLVSYADVLRFAEKNNLVHPAEVDARVMNALDAMAMEASARFEAIELSPVAPFGMNALAGIDQNNILTATRGTEVLSDPTTAMAIECARRRRRGDRSAPVRLATSQRLIRMQPFDEPGFARHFRIFSLVTAGRDSGDERFQRQALFEHFEAWLLLVEKLRENGYSIPGVRIDVSDTRIMRAILTSQGIPLESLRGHKSPAKWIAEVARSGFTLPGAVDDPTSLPAPTDELRGLIGRVARVREDVFHPLQRRFPDLRAEFDFSRLHGLAYYEGLVLHIHLKNADGVELPVGDGGFVTWTQSLLSDRKERLLASAVGTELLYKMFRAKSPA
jgi:hypothetical protein